MKVTHLHIFVLFAVLYPSVSLAKAKVAPDSKVKFFSSSESEWAYQIPECALMDLKQMSDVSKLT